jgi:hypothetical protein
LKTPLIGSIDTTAHTRMIQLLLRRRVLQPSGEKPKQETCFGRILCKHCLSPHTQEFWSLPRRMR